jgi:hypothetical protein
MHIHAHAHHALTFRYLLDVVMEVYDWCKQEWKRTNDGTCVVNFLALRTHAHHECVCMCQLMCVMWSPCACNDLDLLENRLGAVVGGTAVMVTLSVYIAVVVKIDIRVPKEP